MGLSADANIALHNKKEAPILDESGKGYGSARARYAACPGVTVQWLGMVARHIDTVLVGSTPVASACGTRTLAVLNAAPSPYKAPRARLSALRRDPFEPERPPAGARPFNPAKSL